MQDDHRNLAEALSDFHDLFTRELRGLSSIADRRLFAYLLLCRLLIVYDLQVAGFLGKGDRWYLHNHIGSHDDAARGSFFKHFLQPFFHQGLGLPPQERSRSLQQRMGEVPYLGGHFFSLHALEQQSPSIDFPDAPLEHFLGWLAENAWYRQQDIPAEASIITLDDLSDAFFHLLNSAERGQSGNSLKETLGHHRTVAQGAIDACILAAMSEPSSTDSGTIDQLLTGLTDARCRALVSRLSDLTLVDPACGSGRLLLFALERLQKLYQICWTHAQQSQDRTLQTWAASLITGGISPQWAITHQILTQTLYGVDIRPEAIAVTQTQLWLRLLATTQPKAGLRSLPDLDLNLVQGNALIGFIRVDEESYDRVVPKRSKQPDDRELVLQGNLLQPLAAANYRNTLQEKQISLEHYQAQTSAMGAEGGIPEYVQTAFLRDRVDAVNRTAQQKLDTLLFETLSRKLGIQIREPTSTGRAHKRLLTRADVAALHPFHWGFYFHTILESGGFDIVLTAPPSGTLRPQTEAFFQQYEDLFAKHQIDLAAFRRSRRQLLQTHSDLATQWATYAGRITCLRDYVRRSEDYQIPLNLNVQKSIPLQSLFAQRIAQLKKANGVPPYILE